MNETWRKCPKNYSVIRDEAGEVEYLVRGRDLSLTDYGIKRMKDKLQNKMKDAIGKIYINGEYFGDAYEMKVNGRGKRREVALDC